MSNLESHQEAYDDIKASLASLKEQVSDNTGESTKLLTALENGIFEGKPKSKELIDKIKSQGTDKIKKALFNVVDKELGQKGAFNVSALSLEEKVMLALYIEGKSGDDKINFLQINNDSQKEVLEFGLSELLKEHNVINNAKVDQSIEKTKEQEDIEDIRPLKTAQHLQNFVNKLPDIFKTEPMVFSEDTMDLLQEKVTREAFQNYYSDLYKGVEKADGRINRNDAVVVALYSMMHLGVQSFPIGENEGFLEDSFNSQKEVFEKRMEARADVLGIGGHTKNFKDSSERKSDGNKERDYSSLEKPFSEYTRGDLGMLLELGNIGQYFLHNSTTWKTDFGKISNDLKDKEFIVNFHNNDLLENTVGLGMLLATTKSPYITKVEVGGREAVLKMPPEVATLGYYYADGKGDKDGDAYAEVYTGVKVKILEVSNTVVKKRSGGQAGAGFGVDNVTKEYNGNIESFIDLNRREDVEKYVDERLLMGGLDVSKMKVRDLEALKASGYDIAKFFIRGTNGEFLEGGVDAMTVGESYQVNIPSKHLEKYLSAGLLLAPNFFKGDKSDSTEYISEIAVNGYAGKLDKGAKNKIGFYGSIQDKKANSYDQAAQNKYYRDIYDGDVITVKGKGNIADGDTINLDKDYYDLATDLPNMSNFTLGETLSIGTKTTSERDKQLILESIYKKLVADDSLLNDFGNLIKKGDDGVYEITADSLKNGLVYDEVSGSFLMSKELRDAMLETEFGSFQENITDGNMSEQEVIEKFSKQFGPLSAVWRWNARRNRWSNLCMRRWREWRVKVAGLPAVYGDADNAALTFGGFKEGVRKYPRGSKSTIKAVVDGFSNIEKYLEDNSEAGKLNGNFDYVDIFSKGVSKTGKELNARNKKLGIGDGVPGVVIQGKIYVVDSYKQKGEYTERKFRANGELLKTRTFDNPKLIPLDKYFRFKKRQVRRMVFHDAPGIDNAIAKVGYTQQKIEQLGDTNGVINGLTEIEKGDLKKRGGVVENFTKNQEHLSTIKTKAEQYGVDYRLVIAMIVQESKFDTTAGSHKGAYGLMQLMPDTAAEQNVNSKIVEQNIEGGTKYIGKQLRDFGGRLDYALAAYNAGPGNMRKYEKRIGNIPPFRETRNYVREITAMYQILKKHLK